MKTIDQLPDKSGEYILTITLWHETFIEKRVTYDYDLGKWHDHDKTLIGNTDKIIHEAEYWDIISFRAPDNFD